MLIVGGMIVGACLYAGVAEYVASRPVVVHAPTVPAPTPPSGALRGVSLSGPDGSITLPSGEATVVHVWLQGCADCMPAFEAMRRLQSSGGLGVDVPEVNVSYGSASPDWAADFGVRRNLVHDLGGARVVKPLGISSFTTLVLDRTGAVVHSDRPDRAGYVARVQAAVRRATSGRPARPLPIKLSREAIEEVARANAAGVRRECWERGGASERARSLRLVATFSVDRAGSPVNVAASGDDAPTAACVARIIRTWSFEPTQEPTDVSIPFDFVRD